MFSRDRQLLLAASAIVLLVAALALYREIRPGYAAYQEEFRRIVEERFGPERAAAVPSGLQQIWLSSANRVDRCTSCHLGVSWQGLSDVAEPYRTHPAKLLTQHPVDRFGCTYCHGGQGTATKLPDAHGWVSHWEEPLLDTRLAEDYGIRDRWAFVEIRCNVCHRFDRKVDGAPYINEGKQLIRAKGCRACHVINGRGGLTGPDLTWIGQKNPEQYDYSRLTTLKSLFSWEVGHLQNPKSFSPDTVMPNFGFQTREADSIAMVLMSWRSSAVPPELLPGAILKDVPTPEEAERERIMREGEGKFFVEKTCFICHDVSSLGITSATKIGPDLAQAVEDAPRRFGRTLDNFLMNPSGTMQVVLSKQIRLTDDEKREALRLLKIAYEKYQKQEAKQAEPKR
jgi:cytochrome c2